MDLTKSKVTPEGIGFLLFGLYQKIKTGESIALNKLVESFNLPVQPITTALKEVKILENQGTTGPGARWKWLPASPPSDILIQRIYNHYMGQLQTYQNAMQRKKDAKKGIDRENSGPATPGQNPNGQPSVYIRERLDNLEDRLKYAIDMLETLCNNLGVFETLGGRKIQ